MILSPTHLQKALDAALSTGADFADIFVEDTWSSSLSLLNGLPDGANVGELYGAGVRLFFGHEIVYVTTNDLSEEGLVRAALQAARSRPSGKLTAPVPLSVSGFDSTHTFGAKPWQIDREKKLSWLRGLDQSARARSSLVTQVMPSLSERVQRVQIANSNGLMKFDERVYSRIAMQAIVEQNGVKEGFHNNHGQMTTSEFFDGWDGKTFAEEIVDKALGLTKAAFAPAGEMPVVIDNGFGGVIFHEACGHGVETTSVAKNASVFAGQMGQMVASDVVTAIDEGAVENAWGSLKIDDEGREVQKTTLIENGVLKSYLVDEMGSRQTGFAPTGSGRRQSYKLAPASRMRNTYIAAGKTPLEEMIRDVDYGLYAKTMGGGSVSPATGDYNFAVTEGFIIRNGRIEEAVKGATLIGRGIDTLKKVKSVGSELKMAVGTCGSVSGSIPVTVGQPAILVSNMLVGGRSK